MALVKILERCVIAFVFPLNSSLFRYWFPMAGLVLRDHTAYLKRDVKTSCVVLGAQGKCTVLCSPYLNQGKCGHVCVVAGFQY